MKNVRVMMLVLVLVVTLAGISKQTAWAQTTSEEAAQETPEQQKRAFLDVQERTAIAQKEVEQAEALKNLTYGLLGLVLLGIILVCFLFVRKQNIQVQIVGQPVPPVPEALQPERFMIEEGIQPAKLREFVANNPTLSALLTSTGEVYVPCTLTLPSEKKVELLGVEQKKPRRFDGRKFNCTALLSKAGVLIFFDEDPTEPKNPATWRHKNNRAVAIAAELALKQGNVA